MKKKAKLEGSGEHPKMGSGEPNDLELELTWYHCSKCRRSHFKRYKIFYNHLKWKIHLSEEDRCGDFKLGKMENILKSIVSAFKNQHKLDDQLSQNTKNKIRKIAFKMALFIEKEVTKWQNPI